MVTMTTKLFKRTNTKDVFDSVAGDEPEDAETQVPDDNEPEASEGADPVGDDGVPDDDSDGSDDSAEPAPTGKRRWSRYLAGGFAGLIVVAVLGVSGLSGWQWYQQKQIDRASAAALSTAQDFAVVLTSMDGGKVDENFDRVVAGSTGSFKDAYTQSASQLRQVLIDNKAASKGTVIDSAVKSTAKDRVEVLLFVDQWITNAANPQPRLDRSRVGITMSLIDGRWLASDVELK